MVRPLTTQALRVLRPFVEHSKKEISGIEVIRSSKLASGTVYPIMLRLERAGLLMSRWEMEDPEVLGRQRRRYYALTPIGAAAARKAFADVRLR